MPILTISTLHAQHNATRQNRRTLTLGFIGAQQILVERGERTVQQAADAVHVALQGGRYAFPDMLGAWARTMRPGKSSSDISSYLLRGGVIVRAATLGGLAGSVVGVGVVGGAAFAGVLAGLARDLLLPQLPPTTCASRPQAPGLQAPCRPHARTARSVSEVA